MSDPSIQDLLDAYNLLLCPARKPTIDALRRLQIPALKSAYRKKVLETHPDRSRAVGEIEAEMCQRFIDVCTAYDTLKSAIHNNIIHAIIERTGLNRRKTVQAKPFQKTPVFRDCFYAGDFPKRKMLIGQYLYYSKVISWKTLIDAIIWQQRQRPLIGQLALRWGILSLHEIKKILIERNRDKLYMMRFGEYALQKGYISPFEHMALLGKQLSLHRPIGEYFTRKKILRPHELDRMLKKLSSHNKEK